MKAADSQPHEPHCPFLFTEPSYESYVFSQLHDLYRFLKTEKQAYAFFGGVAVAAYSEHLPRTLHDLDLIIPEGEEDKLVLHLRSQGFSECPTRKAHHAHFRKFLFEDYRYQMIVAIFPGKFTLIDLADASMPPIGSYDFRPALEGRVVRSIRALGGEGSVPVITVPIEDLIITKLWPTLEPKLIHDLILLLGSEAASHMDLSYLAARIKEAASLRPVTLETLNRFLSVYDKSLWSRGLPTQATIRNQARCLIDALDSTNVVPNI